MDSTWTESDFDSLGWHDIHVHGFRIVEGDRGVGELVLDIDYILDRIQPESEGGSFRFRIAPAELIFRDVSSLRMSLDYTTPVAAMAPFSIDGIERERITHGNGYESFVWTLAVNWPVGLLTFESPGFSQRLSGKVVETKAQHLTVSERTDPPVA